ncbi:MAG: hypothetical protein JJ863_34320 [Deltaproteobacteria bacterium]|nr:hypothetical protein [Deltaproteobacteria bacterium]
MSSTGDGTDGVDRAALYVYPGDFERRGLQIGGTSGDEWVEGSIPVETQYPIAGSRLTWKEGATPGSNGTGFENEARLTYAVTNLIQSTSAVIDLFSGQLIERGTYYPNGARETLRTERGEGFSLEPMGFTGKEGDDEVGLVYFGERYLMPHLGRWASPDPLQVHGGGGGEFGNSYHYVAGNLLQARDPLGLKAFIAGSEVESGSDTHNTSDSVAIESGWRDFKNQLSSPGEEALFELNRETGEITLSDKGEAVAGNAEALEALSDEARQWIGIVKDRVETTFIHPIVLDASDPGATDRDLVGTRQTREVAVTDKGGQNSRGMEATIGGRQAGLTLMSPESRRLSCGSGRCRDSITGERIPVPDGTASRHSGQSNVNRVFYLTARGLPNSEDGREALAEAANTLAHEGEDHVRSGTDLAGSHPSTVVPDGQGGRTFALIRNYAGRDSQRFQRIKGRLDREAAAR